MKNLLYLGKNIKSHLFIAKQYRQVITQFMARKPVVLWKSWVAKLLGGYFIYLQVIGMFTGMTSAWPWPRNN